MKSVLSAILMFLAAMLGCIVAGGILSWCLASPTAISLQSAFSRGGILCALLAIPGTIFFIAFWFLRPNSNVCFYWYCIPTELLVLTVLYVSLSVPLKRTEKVVNSAQIWKLATALIVSPLGGCFFLLLFRRRNDYDADVLIEEVFD